jgi:hypothetical protein
VTGDLFLAGLWRALLLPRRIDYMGMRHDHATRPGEQREVKVGIEASRRSISLDFFKKIRTIGIVLLTHPDQEIIDGKSLPIERGFTCWEHSLPGLRLIDKIEAWWDRQRRIEEELF